jgi:hypothetical protein
MRPCHECDKRFNGLTDIQRLNFCLLDALSRDEAALVGSLIPVSPIGLAVHLELPLRQARRLPTRLATVPLTVEMVDKAVLRPRKLGFREREKTDRLLFMLWCVYLSARSWSIANWIKFLTGSKFSFQLWPRRLL